MPVHGQRPLNHNVIPVWRIAMNGSYPVPKLIPAAALAVSALVSPLIVQAQQSPHAGMKGSGMDSSMPAGKMDMKSMMKGNNEKMSSMAMTGNPDVDFAQMMRIHHQGAIDMAQGELRDGKDPQLLKMAKEIISAQKKEIAVLDAFLARSGKAPAGAK
jgi:uncharacterized protein (DUF305 family)